jgi:hypothetical protein
MFILDSLFLSGFQWVLDTVRTAAEAERDDDTSLREQLLDAEMRREMGEISDDDFAEIEADLLARIREIKERRDGGSGPIAFGGKPLEATPDAPFQVEATLSGDFHEEDDRSKGSGSARSVGSTRSDRSSRSGSSGTVIEGTVLESVPVEEPRTKGTKGTTRTRTSRTARPRRTPPRS